MVISCAAINCSNRHKKGSRISFYRFPLAKKDLCEEWIRNVRRLGFKPTHHHAICSDHFEDSCFLAGYVNIKKLKPDAVPTKFNVPTHLVKVSKERKPPAARPVTSAEDENIDENQPSSSCGTNVLKEHGYHISSSPKTLKRKLECVIQRKDDCLKRARKQLFQTNRKCSALSRKILNLKELLLALQKENLLNKRSADMINECFNDVSLELFDRIKNPSNKQFCNTLKSFALTLNFYSPAAYRFVREALQYSLPCNSTIRRWYNTVDGRPGFSSEALEALKQRVKNSPHSIYGTVIFDEMSIKSSTEWDGSQFVGYVDLGGIRSTEQCEGQQAREALVIMFVALNAAWKIPIAYYLINGISADTWDLDPVIFGNLRRLDLEPESTATNEESDFPYNIFLCDLSEYSNNIVVYIAGFVARKVSTILKCPECIECLTASDDDIPFSDLLNRKNNGGLFMPSKGLVFVCRQIEKLIRNVLLTANGNPQNGKTKSRIQQMLLMNLVSSNLFPDLVEHIRDNVFPENHEVRLLKCISEVYISVRCHHVARVHTNELHKKIVRQHLTKSILFKNQ